MNVEFVHQLWIARQQDLEDEFLDQDHCQEEIKDDWYFLQHPFSMHPNAFYGFIHDLKSVK